MNEAQPRLEHDNRLRMNKLEFFHFLLALPSFHYHLRPAMILKYTQNHTKNFFLVVWTCTDVEAVKSLVTFYVWSHDAEKVRFGNYHIRGHQRAKLQKNPSHPSILLWSNLCHHASNSQVLCRLNEEAANWLWTANQCYSQINIDLWVTKGVRETDP